MRLFIQKRKLEKKSLNLKEFYERRNKILILRETGGLGDILMHRMIFEDFKKIDPEINITFACPRHLQAAAIDHPFIDNVVDYEEINEDDYHIIYNTTMICSTTEMKMGNKNDRHRSDIWANWCGINLTNHEMHIRLSDEEKEFGRKRLEQFKKPVVIFSPISAMNSKNLDSKQTQSTVNELKKMNLSVVLLHDRPVDVVDCDMIYGVNIRQWMSIINASDYVISVDTSTFHCAGGLKKPIVGIFAWADGYLYSKYYPTTTIVQLHRKNPGGLSCCACYNYPACPLDSNNERKPCITGITSEMIINGFKQIYTV